MASDGKIQALNTAVREMVPHLVQVAEENPHAELLFRALAFSTGCRWHVAAPTPVADLAWTDLGAGGYTDMGAALAAVAEQMSVPPMEERALAPAIVLVSDGQPTDRFDDGLERLLSEPFGARAARLAVAIGRDADIGVLRRFQGGGEPLLAHDPEQLVRSIRWASTAATRAASEPAAATPRFGPAPWTTDPGAGDVTW
jgi:uncharacterized protein YegL